MITVMVFSILAIMLFIICWLCLTYEITNNKPENLLEWLYGRSHDRLDMYPTLSARLLGIGIIFCLSTSLIPNDTRCRRYIETLVSGQRNYGYNYTEQEKQATAKYEAWKAHQALKQQERRDMMMYNVAVRRAAAAQRRHRVVIGRGIIGVR